MAEHDKDGSSVEVLSTHAPTTIPEEPTPSSPASPPVPRDSVASEAARPVEPTSADTALPQPPKQQPAVGRFIENISTDGSRASAEDEAEAHPQTASTANEVPEMEMKDARSTKPNSNVLRRSSKKNTATQPSRLVATGSATSAHDQHVSPSTDGSTQRDSPHPNNFSSPSDENGQQSRAFKKIKGDRSSGSDSNEKRRAGEDDDDHDDDDHPILAALYPLTNFIGYRPLSHPHTPPERRRTPSHPKFNRFHYVCGCIFSLGLPVSGETGEIARYRNPDTGTIELVRMYKDQVGAKVINSIHSVIAAWVVIALLSLVSRSPFHRAHNAPLIIGAFATEAVVSFYAYRTPLAQPKNILLGNTISSVIGVAMEKAFSGTSYSVNGVYGIDWAAAATTVAVAVFAMQILGFTHPPGAAIAILAITNQETHQLDWWLVPIVIIGSLIVIGWAMIINNVGGRRYPENWFYMNAFAEPPIIGPEKLPFTNSPFHPPASRHGHKRKRDRGAEEKGFYRVPDSGARVTHGFGAQAKREGGVEPQPKSKVVGAAGMASHNMGGAARVRQMESMGSQTAGGSKQSANGNGEDGRTTRASEVTKVDSIETPAVPQPNAGTASTQQQPVASSSTSTAHAGAPSATAATTTTAPPAPASASGSKMIETDATLVSRNNSKGSKRSRRSVVVHVNENRRASAGSIGKVPPVPAVQWRGP